MKRKWLFVVAMMMLVVLVWQPTGGEAASLTDIKKQIAAAKAEMRAAEQRAAKAEREAANVKQQAANAHQQAEVAESEKGDIENKKAEALASINNIMAEIDNVVINKTNALAQRDEKEEELLQTGLELDQAEERVTTRDELLQSRMRLMYTNGFVSYMDVLLSATSFTDFIDRFDALQSILSQDRDILAEQRQEKELVALKKVEVEKQFGEMTKIYEKLEQYEAHLAKKEEEKQLMIASYNSNIQQLDGKLHQLDSKLQQIDSTLEELEGISKEQEDLLMALAAKVSKLNAEKNSISNPYSGGKLGMPIRDNYRVSSNFGTRVHPITGKKHTHTGIDFAAPQGTDIYAAEDGVVLVAQSWSSYGNCVIIDHGNGLWTLYGHIRNGGIKVEKGEKVQKGQKIAEVGSTGNSTGPHLHFEVRVNQTPVNPSSYLK
ncbi:murein hydrolase activator EnvC family protein [Paenibacillus sinopodophylli]|uniref:murein hydrolase activator EnvC family protein n=1 Tax=Paenibacillus sinopodophylli TaxID=1837342 RepID=UPI00110CC9DA|nr:M23 family metallopeptidase [Paenibacillus sinopodophylli]